MNKPRVWIASPTDSTDSCAFLLYTNDGINVVSTPEMSKTTFKFIEQSDYDILYAQNKRLSNRNKEFEQKARERNLQLDALHFVWCDGGCEDGLHRWCKEHTVEEIDQLLVEAEKNIKRLKSWIINFKHI